MITIKDVAAEAGVAISTVSKVLNGYPGVSSTTKEKVNNAVSTLGFTPNAVASALSSKKSGRIAILMNMGMRTGAIDEINMQYLSGAIKASLDVRLDAITIFFNMIEDMDRDTLIAYLQSQSIEGLIIIGLSMDDTVLIEVIESETFKCVVIDAPLVNASTSVAWINHEQAQYDIIMKTLDGIEGKRILYIAGKPNSFVTENKIRGIRRLEQDLETKATIRFGNYSELTAREICFQKAKDVDLIACGSDLMAIGAMRALMEMDIFKPVCGFDGIMLMAYAGKQMNTVKQDFAAISGVAVIELKRLLDGGSGEEVIIPYELVRMKYEDAFIHDK